ncbi:Beta-galactosidase GanA [compost metagenome]
MVYTDDFYAERPVLTRNSYGQGQTYYIGSQFEARFYEDLYKDLITQLPIRRHVEADMPTGIFVTARSNEKVEYLFVQNFTSETQLIPALGSEWSAVTRDIDLNRDWTLASFEVLVAKRSLSGHVS